MRTQQAFLVLAVLIIMSTLGGCTAHTTTTAATQTLPKIAEYTSPAGDELACLGRNMRAVQHLDVFCSSPINPPGDLPVIAGSLLTVPYGKASGVAISHAGHILTVAHLLTNPGSDAVQIRVVIWDRSSGTRVAKLATVMAVDEKNDLAVIKIDHRFEDVMPIGHASEIAVGSEFYGVGFPFDVGLLVTKGYFMGFKANLGEQSPESLIMDVRSGPAASGAPLVSPRTGNLIGVMQGTHLFLLKQVEKELRHPVFDFIRWGSHVSNVRRLLTQNGVPFVEGSAEPQCPKQ